ncbi:MAG: cytochrome c3 family protein [Phycisphaerae bacterium]|nr:cytochrome c3 family protein [Phycisphaerae bacterium]
MNSGSTRSALAALVLLPLLLATSVLAAPPDYSKGCSSTGCHDGFAKRAVIHDPLESCDICHELTDEAAHRFTFTTEGNGLCLDCHDAFEGDVKHDAVTDGACTDCHDPHGSAQKGLLLQPQAALCGDCHDDVVDGLKYQHGPVAAGSCTVCHAPHASSHKHLLVEEGKPLCLKCHAAMKDRLDHAKVVHEAVSDDCTSCHRPHSADNAKFLTQGLPTLCMDCHDDIGEQATEAKVKHSVVTVGRACANCHDAHASAQKALLPETSMKLCLSCHDREVTTTDGRKLKNIAQIIEKPVKHGPIEDGDCVTCHAAHGSSFVALASEAYPASFYAPYDAKTYALCLDCHDGEAMAEAETESATGFRNGKQNLHYLHVHRSPKGRTCRACHDVHATERPKLIADSVPFGAWDIPIKFRESPAGGSCAPGCHRPFRYNRETPVINMPDDTASASN